MMFGETKSLEAVILPSGRLPAPRPARTAFLYIEAQ
jgi:hypothetical protein